MPRHVHRFVLFLAIPMALSGALGGLTTERNDEQGSTPAPGVVRFGSDAASISAQRQAGFTPDLGTVWVGPWTLRHGWVGTDEAIRSMVAADIQPVVHFYYWGDDLSVRCLERGCWSTLHDIRKDTTGWQRLAKQLVDHLEANAAGVPVMIVLETEFNRGNVARHEPLDEHLAKKADFLRAGYPAAEIVLGLGNWNRNDWDTWDRAAAASDMVGFQLLRASTRDTPDQYGDVVNASRDAANEIRSLFDRPAVIHDVGLSSHPEPSFALQQARTMRDLFEALPELKEAGVRALLYRSWFDDPGFDTSNHYGVAERHWGLAWPEPEANKPAAAVWVAGVLGERTGETHKWPALDPVPVGREGGSLDGDRFVWRRAGTATTDGRAAEGVAWTLSEGGSLLQPMRFEPGDYRVEVRARAPAVLASDAALELSWNGQTTAWFRPGTGYGVHSTTMHLGGAGDLALSLATNATAVHGSSVLVDEVRFVWTNGPPQVDIAVESQGLMVVLDARGSMDPDGDEMRFQWALGDGDRAVGPRVVHRYDAPGSYEVTLTVDAANETVFRSTTVQAGSPGADQSGLRWLGVLALGLLILVSVLVRSHRRA